MKLEEGKKGVVTLSATSCPAKSSARRAPAPDSVGKLPVACTGCSTATQVSYILPLPYLFTRDEEEPLPAAVKRILLSFFVPQALSEFVVVACGSGSDRPEILKEITNITELEKCHYFKIIHLSM